MLIVVSQKVIFHLEAFVAKFMRIVERSVLLCLYVPYVSLIVYSYIMGMGMDDF